MNGLGRGLLRYEPKLQVVDDPVDDGVLREEGNDLHPAPAFGTEHGVDFIDLSDHGRPALGRKAPELLLNHPEGKVLWRDWILPRCALA